MSASESTKLLVKSILALRDYADTAVLIGGHVPQLYRHFDWASEAPPFAPTFDVDWALPNKLPSGRTSVRQRLQEHGLTLLQDTLSTPPVQRFQDAAHGNQPSPHFVEFLTPLQGKETDRDGKSRSPLVVQKALKAQALRYLDLLLIAPITLDVGEIDGFGLEESTLIQLPHPAMFCVQKILASTKRSRVEKQVKDWHDIFDVGRLSRVLWPEFNDVVVAARRTTWFDKAEREFRRRFLETSEAPVAVETFILNQSEFNTTPASTIEFVAKGLIDALFTGR